MAETASEPKTIDEIIDYLHRESAEEERRDSNYEECVDSLRDNVSRLLEGQDT